MTDYFRNLELELKSAAARQRAAAGLAPGFQIASRRRLTRRSATAAVGILLLVGVPAVAATGVFRPFSEPDGLVRLSERREIASGTTPDGRSWQLLASQSDQGFCFGIRLPNPRPQGLDTGTSVSEGCGGKEPGALSLATSSGGSFPKDGLAFGTAPDEASRVRVEANGVATTVDTIDDDAGVEGRLFVAQLPTREDLTKTKVVALDEADKTIATFELP